MKITIILLLVVVSSKIYSQSNECDSLIVNNHYMPFKFDSIYSTMDYIKKKWFSYAEHINNKSELLEIPLWVMNEKEVIFHDSMIAIRIHFKHKKFNGNKLFYPKDKEEKYSMILDKSELTPYGITSEDTLVKYISNFQLNSINISDFAFDDLLNPNICKTFLAIKPIKAYYSKTKEFIYVYIYGDLKTDIMLPQHAFNFSYMAKLIFKPSGEYVGRIVERGEILKYFNFHQCSDFIGF